MSSTQTKVSKISFMFQFCYFSLWFSEILIKIIMIHFTLSPGSAEAVMIITQMTKKITTAPPQFAIFGEVCSEVKLFIKTKKKT